MALRLRLFRIVGHALLLLGASMLLVVAVAYIHRAVSLRTERARFIAKQEQMRRDRLAGRTKPIPPTAAAVSQRLESSREPLALLRIPRLRMEVPVLEGTDEITLNRGVGLISGTSLPGDEGNIGIAGHRDSFFRPLEDIQVGDTIELLTLEGKHFYAVDGMRVVSPSETDVLRQQQKNSMTLVTCYPFRFIGSAPSRYIVEASLKQ